MKIRTRDDVETMQLLMLGGLLSLLLLAASFVPSTNLVSNPDFALGAMRIDASAQ